MAIDVGMKEIATNGTKELRIEEKDDPNILGVTVLREDTHVVSFNVNRSDLERAVAATLNASP